MTKEILNKPNQTIMIDKSCEISATQRKAYNIILFDARKELLINKEQNYFYFSIIDLKRRAGIKATDNWHLKKDLDALSDIKFEVVKDKKDDWGFFRLISAADKEGDLLRIELPGRIKEALIANDYYTALDLLIIKRLKSKYSVILYEIALRYRDEKNYNITIPKLTIEEFKKLTGTENYKNFSDIRRFCIEPAIKEIFKKTDIKLGYDIETVGRKTTSIKFKIIKSEKQNKIEKIYQKEVETLFAMLSADEQLESRKEDIEKLLKQHSFEYLEADIKYCNRKKPKNYWGYFLKSTKEGHFSKDDIKKEKNREAKQQILFKQQLTSAEPEIEKVAEIGRSAIQKIKDNLKKKEL